MKNILLPYGWIGLLVMVISEILLFRSNRFLETWMTPVMWSGYILFIDNIIFKRTGKSMITLSRQHFSVIMILSIGSWLIFEGYNINIKNWYYINLPQEIWVRYLGYAWSFSTITPVLLLTADFLSSFGIFENSTVKPLKITNKLLGILIAAGAFMTFYPLFFPNKYLFPSVWCGFILLIDPLNYILGGRSLLSDFKKGRPSKACQLLLAGAICGVLWEFWNYWATTKWIYTVPYFPEIKVFEMPIAGYLGFPPFAIECFVLYQLFKIILEKAGFLLRYS